MSVERVPRPDRREIMFASIWFYVVAFCTLLNSVILVIGPFIDLYAGLFFTQAFDAAMTGLSTIEPEESVLYHLFPYLALAADAFVAGIVVFVGRRAGRGVKAAFIVGLVCYGIDTVLFVLGALIGGSWIPVIVHILGLVLISRGLAALNRLDGEGGSAPGLSVRSELS